MNKRYFLHTESLLVDDFATYKSGLEKLNYLSSENDEYDCILKHESVYNNPLYLELCGVNHSESSGVLKYMEQCSTSEIDIVNDIDFEIHYPLWNVGFLGIDFSLIHGVDILRQITNSESHTRAKKHFIKKILANGGKQHIEMCLRWLYPEYTFETGALQDIEVWQNTDNRIISWVIELIDDIGINPFTGGIGQTEVLKGANGMASKRINRVDRITYTLNQGIVTIHRCRSHYE